MNRLLAFILLLTASVAGAAGSVQDSNADSVLFRNGEFLYGKCLAIDHRGAVQWQHPDAAEIIDFTPGNVDQIDFAPTSHPVARAATACRLLLNDGSSLEGDLVSCDRSGLVLQTWYAGRLNIPRASLQSLVFIPRSPAVIDGITGLDGWTQGASSAAVPGESGRWIFRNGAFYADRAASIARDVKLPDVAQIQFDLAWKGGLNLAVALYTDSLLPVLLTAKEQGPNFGGFYSLRFQFSAFIDLWPIKKLEPLRPLGQLYIPTLNTSDRLHVDLRVSKPEHKFALWLDGKEVKEWTDPMGFAGEGTGVRFVQNPPGIIKLSNLRITQWDGNFSPNGDAADDATQDSVWPNGAARVFGKITAIAENKLILQTKGGAREFPLETLNAIDFVHQEPKPAAFEEGMVRATFARGGNLTFVLESWRPDVMIVRSQELGKLKVNSTAFTQIRFLLPEKKPAESPKS
jgi:hypothetical protein